jgi:hypothetical protein
MLLHDWVSRFCETKLPAILSGTVIHTNKYRLNNNNQFNTQEYSKKEFLRHYHPRLSTVVWRKATSSIYIAGGEEFTLGFRTVLFILQVLKWNLSEKN